MYWARGQGVGMTGGFTPIIAERFLSAHHHYPARIQEDT